MVLTKAQSKNTFDKVLNEDLQVTGELLKALATLEIDNIVDLQCLTDDDIDALFYTVTDKEDKQVEKRVSFKERKMLKQLLQWADYNAAKKTDRQTHWEDFTSSTLDEFKQVAAATLSGREKGYKSDSSITTTSKIDKFEANVKMDVKQFSVFDGTLEKWLTWKRTTVAQLISYGLKPVTEVYEPSFAMGSNDEVLYQKQNLFFYSVLTARITGGHALTIVRENELTRDGRKCFIAMIAWYEAKNNLELVGAKALNRLTSLRLTYNSKGGVALYIKHFSECILDLEHAQQPLSETQKKIMFLNGIHDTAYGAKIDLLKEDQSKDFATIREQISQKGDEIEARRGPKKDNRQVNAQTAAKQGKGKQNNNNKKRKQHNDYVQPDEWAKLTPQQKKDIIDKRKKQSDDKDEKLPHQYNNRQNNVQQQEPPPNKAPDQGDDVNSMITQSIAPTIRNIMTSQTNQSTATPSPNEWTIVMRKNQALMTIRNINQQVAYMQQTPVLIDSGADTGKASDRCWKFTSWSGKTVGLEGCRADFIVQEPLRIGTAYTVVTTSEGERVLLCHHEMIHDPQGAHDNLSANQIRAHGHQVTDVPKCYGGQQNITLSDGTTLQLQYEAGLLWLPCEYPTSQELRDLRVIELTSESPWEPGMQSDDVITSHNERFRSHEEEPDWEHTRSCLGWKPMDRVKKTLANTTHLAHNVVRLPMRHHFMPRFHALNTRRLKDTYSTDTIFSSDTSIEGYNCAQVYCGRTTGHLAIFGMRTESQMPSTLEDFLRQVGIPHTLRSDNAKVETMGRVKEILRKYIIMDAQSEPHHQNQNHAERKIQEIKSTANILMDRTGTPTNLWFLCMKYVCYLLNHLSSSVLDDKTPMERTFGVTPDISSLLVFHWYEPVLYLINNAPFPATREKQGRWVGISEHVGDALTWIILTDDTQQLLNRSVVRPATDRTNPNYRAINIPDDAAPDTKLEDNIAAIEERIENGEIPLRSVNPEDLIGFHFVHDVNGSNFRAEVLEKLDDDYFRVQLGKEGEREEIMTYVDLIDHIAHTTDGDDADKLWTFKSIEGHRKTPQKKWEVLVNWDNGDQTWEPLDVMKREDPVTIAKYGQENNLLGQPGWKRMRHYVKTNQRFVRYLRQARAQIKKFGERWKFGVQVPRTYKEAIELDKRNGNTLWQEAIHKEFSQLFEYSTFEDVGKDFTKVPPGFKRLTIHIVFDVKYDLRRKARVVGGGHLTEDPQDATYSGIATLRGIRMGIFAGELNNLLIVVGDVGNAYLEAYTREQLYIIAGPEFGPLQGHYLLVRKALYGLHSSGARWAETLADTLRAFGYTQCKADPAIWIKDCDTHYEYVCVWVDDIMVIGKDPMQLLKDLEKYAGYTLKGVGKPEYYLGADFQWKDYPELVLTMGAKTYLKRCFDNVKTMIGGLPKESNNPLEPGDHPEIDTSPECDDKGRQQYQSLMGMLQWLVTLGRFDIQVAVVTMGRFRAAPRNGHLKRLHKIFGYLRKYREGSIKFRTDPPDYSMYNYEKPDWTYVYGNVQEELPPDMPTPKGKAVITTSFVDANLAHCLVTGRSCTGVLHMLNKTPIEWFCKRQSTVETATYGSEFVAARQATEQIMDIRYSLRMMGIPLSGPTYMFGDNLSVIKSATIPQSTLKKRHNALAYHRVREAIARGVIQFYHINGKDNPADVLTKHLSNYIRYPLVQPFLF